MNIRKTVFLMLGAAGVVAGCAAPPPNQAQRVEPQISVRDAANSAWDKYELGRYYQGQQQFDAAARAYEQALVLDPDLTPAANNLAVIEANQGRLERAIVHFQAVLARVPNVAHVHNNLGYAYLLQAKDSAALAEFDIALRLEPGNAKAIANRNIARQRVVTAAPEPSPPRAIANLDEGTNLRLDMALRAPPTTTGEQAP